MIISGDVLEHGGAFLVGMQPLGITGDRPFFLYWQVWVMGLAALGLGLFIGAAF